MRAKTEPIDFVKFADLLAALGTEPRLRIVHHLLRAHPAGLVAGQIQTALGMQPSAVSHHLEKLKHEDLVRVRREGTFLRYTANPAVLRDLLGFLFSQCCAETGAVCLGDVVPLSGGASRASGGRRGTGGHRGGPRKG